jgi:hypothetical protein
MLDLQMFSRALHVTLWRQHTNSASHFEFGVVAVNFAGSTMHEITATGLKRSRIDINIYHELLPILHLLVNCVECIVNCTDGRDNRILEEEHT